MKNIALICLSTLFMIQCSCKRTSEILGPDACPSESFVVTVPFEFKDNGTSSTTNLNLMTSYANVSAEFNEIISYRLTVKGLTSGAEFVLDGKGNTLSYSWYGNSTNGKYFSKDEVLSYKLTNICKTEPLGSGEITLTTNIGYAGFGLKVINFEDSPPVSTSSYGDLLATSSLVTPATSGYMASPQGGNYYKYKATTSASSGVAWYFGGMDFNIVSQFPNLGDDPSRVYLNFFAKGQANSQCQMIIQETLYGTPLNRKFLANVAPDQWKLYSVRLSDIGIVKPSSITNLSLNLGAALYQDATAEVDLDLLIFTFDKPF